MCQDFTTLEGRQGGEWASVEPRVLETETAVHTVSCQLESHLLDVPLHALFSIDMPILYAKRSPEVTVLVSPSGPSSYS